MVVVQMKMIGIFSRDANIITSSMITREKGEVSLRNGMVLSRGLFKERTGFGIKQFKTTLQFQID